MKGLRALEAAVIRLEGIVAVGLVLTMLALAGYNVFYRNVLVRLQKHWAHSGPPITAVVVDESARPAALGGPTPAPSKAAGEGFAGDWDEDDGSAPAADTEAEPDAKLGAKVDAEVEAAGEGFAGDWGEDDGDAAEPDAKHDAKAAPEPESDDLGNDDQFANLPMVDHAGEARTDDGEPLGGSPPEGSFAANMVAFIDRIKLAWIDVVLRQMVILVSFFGAMMATLRSKHINVDALSKLLDRKWRRWLAAATNGLAVYVCVVLAQAGADLVAISRAHPNRIVPWADDWLFQTMFPIGFGLVAFHFAVRLVEALANELPEDTQPEVGTPQGGA